MGTKLTLHGPEVCSAPCKVSCCGRSSELKMRGADGDVVLRKGRMQPEEGILSPSPLQQLRMLSELWTRSCPCLLPPIACTLHFVV